MSSPPPPVRTTTLKTFLKDRSQMRVSGESVDLLAGLLSTIAEKIAVVAAESAVEGDRSTIKAPDVQEGFEAFLGESGPPMLSPGTLHTAIDGVSNEVLTELINLLRADVENR